MPSAEAGHIYPFIPHLSRFRIGVLHVLSLLLQRYLSFISDPTAWTASQYISKTLLSLPVVFRRWGGLSLHGIGLAS